MFALAELQLWLHAEAEPRSPGTRHGPCVLHLFSRDHSTGTKPAELVQGRGTEACSPWLGWTKLLQGGHSKTKPRKDGVWALADFQGDRPPWEGPEARKRHGVFPCTGECCLSIQQQLHMQPRALGSWQEEIPPQAFSIFYAKSSIPLLSRSHGLENSTKTSLAQVEKSLL